MLWSALQWIQNLIKIYSLTLIYIVLLHHHFIMSSMIHSIKYFFKDIPISFNRIGITIYMQVIWYRMRAIIYPAQQRVAYHFFFWRFKSIYNSVIKIVGCPQYSEIVFKNSPHNILCSNQRCWIVCFQFLPKKFIGAFYRIGFIKSSYRWYVVVFAYNPIIYIINFFCRWQNKRS